MNLLKLCAVATSLLGSAASIMIRYDAVAPILHPDGANLSTIEQLAEKFQPMLSIKHGCRPYPAVNKDGDISKGLGVHHIFTSCKASPLGSQVYAREVELNDNYGIMYAYFFPRQLTVPIPYGHRYVWEFSIVWLDSFTDEAKMEMISIKKLFGFSHYHTDTMYMKGDHFKLKYTYSFQTSHYLTATTKIGDLHNVILWSNLTDSARRSLNLYKFGFASKCPLAESEFETSVEKALQGRGVV